MSVCPTPQLSLIHIYGDYKTREDLTDDQVAWLDAHPDFDWDKECEEAKKVADAIKADGWTCLLYTSSLIGFHEKLLRLGPLPFPLVEKYL